MAAPIIAKIDKIISESDKGQREIKIQIEVPKEIVDYLKFTYKEAVWLDVTVTTRPPPAQVVLVRENFK